MLIVGLTGGIASGKSTVSKRLKEKHHLPIVDADVIAHDVVEPGRKAYNDIVAYFGPKVPDLLLENGGLNRAALGRAVFGHDTDRKVLNGIVHPAVRKAMAWQVVKAWLGGASMVIVDVPLLFESKLDRFCGALAVVLCDEKVQLTRLMNRDTQLSEVDARNRIGSQMPTAEKRRLAEHKGAIILDNNGSLQDLELQIDNAVARLQPSTIRTLLEWFPPFGFLAAIYSYITTPK